ncbi:MAG: glycosyltransferase [Micrococcales bacterium]|nr:glycosyltransferase [Micrococcales bacterium]
MPPADRVTVAVPTFRRPAELRRLLVALRGVPAEIDGMPVGVLIVDNDPEGSAAPVVAEVLPAARYVSEPHPGLAAVRNRALDESADSRWLAFIDDDEVPLDGWLPALVRCARSRGAAGVLGRVVSETAIPMSAFLLAFGAFRRPPHRTGDPLSAAATNNLLLDLDFVRATQLRFDPRLGMSGGEDNLFTTRLRRAGGKLIWCDDAVIIEHVPAERVTRRWIQQRTFRTGTVATVVAVLAADTRGGRLEARIRFCAGGTVRLVVGLAQLSGGVILRSVRWRARGTRRLLRGAGMIAGTLGYVHQEYARRRRSGAPRA